MNQCDAIAARIAAFFRLNPDEALTWDDMALKFNCTPKQAERACSYLTLRYGLRRETVPQPAMVRMVVPEGVKP